jgi:hypothetical protein
MSDKHQTMASGNTPGVSYSDNPYQDHKMATHVRRTTEDVDGVVKTASVEVYNEGIHNFVLKYTPGPDRKPGTGSISVSSSASVRMMDFLGMINFLLDEVGKG